jgi:hypothetical protein
VINNLICSLTTFYYLGKLMEKNNADGRAWCKKVKKMGLKLFSAVLIF